jgi:hypothetical protein
MAWNQVRTSSIIHRSLCNLSYVLLLQSYTSISAFATCKHRVISSYRLRVINCNMSEHLKKGLSFDQYNLFNGNFFKSINKYIEI